MWSSQRRLRAPVPADHALCAILIVGGSRIAGRPVVALIVARAFFRPRYCNLGCVQLLERWASSVDAARSFTFKTAER
jgi:hypothetical protein